MAEAARPPRKARPKAKEKKKKCSEEPQKQGLGEVSLPNKVKDQEVSSQSSQMQVEHPEVFTEIQLRNEAEDGKNVNDMCDIPLTSLTLADEGSQTAMLESLTQGKEFRAGLLHEKFRGRPEEDGKNKLDKPQNLMEVANQSANSGIAESTFKCSAACTQSLMGIVQDRGTEQVQKATNPVLSLEAHSVLSQLSNEAKDRAQHSGLKTLYPDLSAELSQERLTTVAVKPLLHKERLYPEILSEPELVPFTKEQLKIFEPCSWLENVESYVEEFETIAHQDRHEFHELLLNYWRCRKQLLLAEAELQAITSNCQNARDRLWTFKEEQQSVKVV